MAHLFFFHGEESFLVEERVKQVQKMYASFNHRRFEGKVEFESLIDAATTVDMFSAGTVMLVKNPSFLMAAASDEILKQLEVLAKSCNESAICVVYLVSKSADMRKKLPARLKKLAQTEVFASFKDWEQDKVMDWIRTRGAENQLTIERDAVFALENLGGSNLRHLSAEIAKLSVYVGEKKSVTKEDVIMVCEAGRGYFFKFQEAVRDRNKNALVYLEKMLDDGEEAVMLLGSVVNQMRLFYQLIDLKQNGVSPQTIAKIVGKNPYYIQKLLPPVMKAYSPAVLKNCFQLLAAADRNIKLGKMRPRAAIETMMLGIL